MNEMKCYEELRIRLPKYRVREIKDHAYKYDGGNLDRFILRAIEIAVQHDKDIDIILDAEEAEYWRQQHAKQRQAGLQSGGIYPPSKSEE